MIVIYPKIVAAGEARDIELLAVLVRTYFGGENKFAPRLDTELLTSTAGIDIQDMAYDGRGAIVARDEHGRFLVRFVIGTSVQRESRRFLVAHMLGHYLLHIQPRIAKGEFTVSGFRESQCPGERYIRADDPPPSPGRTAGMAHLEYDADQFAAALLMPRAMLQRAREKITDDERLAGFFGVSRPMLERRLIETGLRAPVPVNFIDAERMVRSTGREPVTQDAHQNHQAEARLHSQDAAGGPTVHGAGQVQADPAAGAVMPRAVAASSYRHTRTTTGQHPRIPADLPSAGEAPEAVPAGPGPDSRKNPAPRSAKGMERIREIARKLDRSS